MVLGSSVGVLIGTSPGGGTGLEEINNVGLAPEGAPVASLGNSNDVIGRV